MTRSATKSILNMAEVGARLRQIREQRGLGVRDLCERAELSHNAVTRIEAGETKDVQAGSALSLSRVLGVNLEWLLTGEGPQNRKSPKS